MQIHLIAAARPNFMKIAPLYHALKQHPWAKAQIVHTGQHYDLNMSDSFFVDLELPEPHIHLGIGSGSHAQQTGKVMMAYEKVILEQKPDLIIVVGDINSTLACTLAAAKIPVVSENGKVSRPRVAHLEAGLRSFDRTMPEEINRIVTDSLADILWTPSADGDKNLIREGISPEKIERVGNIMIDSIEMMRAKIEQQDIAKKYNLENGNYGVVTFHRPANVDFTENLAVLCTALTNISKHTPLVFPVHPRTRKNLKKFNLLAKLEYTKNITLTDPLSYISFMNLVFNCRLAITDSGGLQEETTYLGIPCLTMRPNTERPVTITQGTNKLCSLDDLEATAKAALLQKDLKHTVPELWDGHTAKRIVDDIKNRFNVQ